MTTKVQRSQRQKIYNQIQPAIATAGFMLALFWLMPTTDTAPQQNIQAEVSK